MNYAILFKESARKELYQLPDKILKKISLAIDLLAENPRPFGVKKLKGKGENLWRLRVGDYRVIYLIDDVVRIVNIRKIGNRREVYDR
jgi:mRNA interferase RelE/StbE